jgi:serine phosphatase RsbU (regulator of sigma subunit)
LAELQLKAGKEDSSESLTRKAIKVFREYRDPTGLILAYERIGRIHRKRGNLDSALIYFQKALPHAKAIKSFEERASLYERIAEVRDRQGKGSKAYDALEKASRFEDSLALREQKKKMAELEAKYEMREQKKELELKEAQLQRKAVQQYGLLGGIGLILIFSGFLYSQYRRKKKANIALREKNQEIEEKKQEILQSLDYASKIQNAVLPNEADIDSYFSSGFVLFKPRDKVSGDLYWMEAYEGRFYLAVVDCTGHGVPGAMISILGHNGLNKAIMEKKLRDPAEILSYLDGQLKSTLGQRKDGKELRDGMDVALCSYDPAERILSFAGAIEPLYLLRNGSERFEVIKGDRQAIGGIVEEGEEEKRFTSHSIRLQEGDRFYIFSDGFPDQFGGKKGKKLKHKAFQRILLEKKDIGELQEQEAHLEKRFEEWRGEHEQVDDVLVIGAQV